MFSPFNSPLEQDYRLLRLQTQAFEVLEYHLIYSMSQYDVWKQLYMSYFFSIHLEQHRDEWYFSNKKIKHD